MSDEQIEIMIACLKLIIKRADDIKADAERALIEVCKLMDCDTVEVDSHDNDAA